jgi:hypothetical protein
MSVDPTIRDLEDHPASRRHAFIACVVTFHCIDYFAHPKKSANLRNLFRNQSPDFAVVDRVAHSFKHLETGHPEAPQNQPLASTYVSSAHRAKQDGCKLVCHASSADASTKKNFRR